MKPGEPIHTGMQVWHSTGKTARVVCLIVTCPPPNVTIESDSTTIVRLTPDDRTQPTFDLMLDLFVANYHRRLTAWERLDELNLEEPAYQGPLEGWVCVSSLDNTGRAIRIPKMERAMYPDLTEEKNLARAMFGAYSEWFEKADPGCWKLVLDPAL